MPFTSLLKEVSIYNGNERAEIYTAEPGSNDMTLILTDGKLRRTITFRNVGARNTDSAIQFNITEYNTVTNRTKYSHFSVPYELAEIFLKHINTAK
jgi:hypothetical protein